MFPQLKRPTPPSLPPTQAGLTIIESLLAVVVVGLVIVAIGPVLAFSAATRLQARRIELGAQAARSYTDALKSGAIPAPIIADSITSPTPDAGLNALKSVPVPSGGSLNCNANQYCSTPAQTSNSSFFCIDGNQDGRCTTDQFSDFIVQASGIQYRANPAIIDNKLKAERGYLLGIRVYRADAFKNSVALQKSLDNQKAQANILAGGFGNAKAPIMESTTEIAQSNTRYDDICKRVGGCGVSP